MSACRPLALGARDPTPDFERFLADFRATVRNAASELRLMGSEDAGTPVQEGKWSTQQIVGHLIDSAANNHQRFVRAQLGPDLVFPGYDQEAWVRTQAHQEASWTDLVNFWEGYNLLLARVMQSCPREQRRRERTRHNLHEIGWEIVPESEPATLEYLMRDYVGHLKHHLRQIDPDLASAPHRQRRGEGFRSA